LTGVLKKTLLASFNPPSVSRNRVPLVAAELNPLSVSPVVEAKPLPKFGLCPNAVKLMANITSDESRTLFINAVRFLVHSGAICLKRYAYK
jgi:hypothetical protein